MAMKSITLITILVVVYVATQAEAQLIPQPLSNLFNISGNVSCSLNGTGANLLPFPNAMVLLRCAGNIIAGATTNQVGSFNFIVSPAGLLIPNLLFPAACNLNVVTPLVKCNATLPSTGILRAPLQFPGPVVVPGAVPGPLPNVVNVVAGIFRWFAV